MVLETRKNRIDYIHNYFNTHKNNMKSSGLVSDLLSISVCDNKTGVNISHLLQDGKEIDDPLKMANIFNKCFINVSKKITSAIPRTRKSPLDYLKHSNNKSFFLSLVALEEVECLINSLEDGKAAGPYSIPVKLLKIFSHQISVLFCMIVNDSFSSGIFPNKLKISKVITLYKKDSRDNSTDYRPISLLSVFSELIGKIMYKRLYSFLDSCSILNLLQFGFREKYSTLHAL